MLLPTIDLTCLAGNSIVDVEAMVNSFILVFVVLVLYELYCRSCGRVASIKAFLWHDRTTVNVVNTGTFNLEQKRWAGQQENGSQCGGQCLRSLRQSRSHWCCALALEFGTYCCFPGIAGGQKMQCIPRVISLVGTFRQWVGSWILFYNPPAGIYHLLFVKAFIAVE